MQDNFTSRLAAIRVLSRWLTTAAFPDRAIPGDTPDRGFVMDLVYGTVRQRRALEWLLSRQVAKMPHGEALAALLAGAYQLFFMPEIPDYAAVDPTVEAAKRISRHSAGFVNAVLRNLLRQREPLRAALAQQPLAIRLSHPDILIDRWLARYGAEATAGLCAWNNRPAETIVTLLPHCPHNAASWLEHLARAGITATITPHPTAPERFVTLPHGAPALHALPGYSEGWFIAQDPATRGAIALLDPAPGQRILDACAAPGGKTMQIAARLMAAQIGSAAPADFTAMDTHRDRLDFLRQNLERTGMKWIRVMHGDAAAMTADKPFDRILLDVPCSNTGVLRRRPDARWRFSEHRLQKLVHQQHAILEHAVTLLAPGGRLVYSTCSLEPEENMCQVDRLLAGNRALRLNGVWESNPVANAIDGAFAAAITRA